MERRSVSSGAVWEPGVGYARAVRVGPFVSVSGTTAAPPDADAVGGDDPAAQMREALRRVVAALAALGATPVDVVRTGTYVTDIARWEQVGRVHGEVFGDVRPATSMVQVEADAVVSDAPAPPAGR